MGGRIRLRVVVTIMAVPLAIVVVFTMLPTTGASGDGPMAEAPLCELYLQMEPEELDIFPTYEGMRNLYLQGQLTVDKYRPGNIIVYIETILDIDWFFACDHQAIPFDHVGAHVAFFRVVVTLPAHTVGPITARLDVRAYLNMAGVDEEDTAFTNIIVMPRYDDYLANVPSESMALNGNFIGDVIVNNLHDEALEFHLSALGEWGELIPDLDFIQAVELAPNEVMETRFHGTIDDEVEEGSYKVDIGLWTPGPEDEHIVITILTVTIHVDWDLEGIDSILLRIVAPLVIFSILTAAGVAYYLRRRRRSYLEETA